MAKPVPASRGPRCAIYTRKSTEDGLEQEFNSLDAQREACAAYVLSQRHEGWVLVPEAYDDGGFSGGSLERPGLRRLLAGVAAGQVNTIIVYKVDRLTRSLADFAKIVEVLDAHGASFVSITQSFNTTTSMGRLTLNVLLSFAQFEREVTGERIRDKIAASKKKGLWMGGPVPLGYAVHERKLIVVADEAATVRHLYQRYLDLDSVRELVAVLALEGRRTKLQVCTSTGHRGGVPFARGTLFHLLKNRIYRGEIVHKGAAYPGEHAAIVSLDLWQAVQLKLADHGPRLKRAASIRHPSLLIGLVVDGLDRRMSPSHATKGTKRYRYYITHADAGSDAAHPTWRVSAHDLERIVVERLRAFLSDGSVVLAAMADPLAAPHEVAAILAATAQAAAALAGSTASARATVIQHTVASIRLREQSVDIAVRRGSLAVDGAAHLNDDTIVLCAPTVRVRRGHEIRLVVSSAQRLPAIDRNERLVALVADAHAARSLLLAAPDRSIDQIASGNGRCRTNFARLIKLSYLAPDLVAMILEGRQPATVSRRRLMVVDLPLGWAEQRVTLGCS